MTPLTSENPLIDALRRGDVEGAQTLYDTYSPPLYGILCARLGPAKGAEALKEVWKQAWETQSLYASSSGTLFTWLLNITRKVAQTMTGGSIALPSSLHSRPVQEAMAGAMLLYGLDPTMAATALHIPPGVAKARSQSALSTLVKSYIQPAQ